MAEGDDETIDKIWDALTTRSDELYKTDGGRDLPAHKHPRTRDQRNFDALTELITNDGSSDSDSGGSGSDSATFHVVTYASDWTEDGPTKGFRLDGTPTTNPTPPPPHLQRHIPRHRLRR